MEDIIMSQFTVITGDVIQSKKYEKIYDSINKRLKNINYPKSMVTPFIISRGDEIQTVFEGNISFPIFLRQIRYILRPLNIRFGIGYGDINEMGDGVNSWTMNGTAFHYARESIDYLDKNNKFITRFKSNNCIIDEAINTILYLIDTLQFQWTASQWEAIYFYEKMGTYKKVAEELDIAFQNVGKRCKAAKWKEVNYAEQSISNLLKNIE